MNSWLKNGSDLEPQRFDQAQQQRVAGGAVEAQVKLAVVLQIGLDVALVESCLHGLAGLLQLLQGVGIHTPGALLGGQTFQAQAYLQQVPIAFGIHLRNVQ